MKKLLLILLYGVILFVPVKNSKNYENIQNSFKDSYQIELIVNDSSSFYDNNDKEYYNILFEFEKMILDSHQMPALGVSMDKETKEAKTKGVWIEFKFNSTQFNNDLPFDSLLVEVNPQFYGFNIIRKYNGVYEGRCFYLNLEEKSMKNLYNYLVNYEFD